MLRIDNLFTRLAVLLGVAAAAHGADGDWPQWRGPNRDGLSTETGLLKKWPAKGPPLVWKTTGIGVGYSSVSVAQGRIFTMGEDSTSSHLRSLKAVDGALLWSAPVGKPGGGDGYPGPRATPTVDGDLVFAVGQHGDLVCVEAPTGKVKWRKNLETDFHGEMMSGWGYAESPLVDGDKLVCTPGGPRGTILALDKKTGDVVWRTKKLMDNAAYSSLVVAEIHGARQYIQLTDASVVGVGASDGSLLWRAERPGQVAVIPTPIVHDDLVYVASGYSVGCNLFKITTSGNGFKAQEVYANKVMVNHHGGVVLVGEYVYGYSDSKGWVCQQFNTGGMIWEEKGKLGKGSLTYADGNLYLREEDGQGTVALVEAASKGYKENGRFAQPDRSKQNSWPHPVVAGGKLFLRDQNVLLCYDVKTK